MREMAKFSNSPAKIAMSCGVEHIMRISLAAHREIVKVNKEKEVVLAGL